MPNGDNGRPPRPGRIPPFLPIFPDLPGPDIPFPPPDDGGGDLGFQPPVFEVPVPIRTVPPPQTLPPPGPSLGTILGRIGIVTIGGAIAIEILRRAAIEQLEEELAEKERAFRTQVEQRALKRPIPELDLPPFLPPEPQFEEPDRDLIILPRPQRQPLPGVDAPPEITTAPLEIPAPSVPATAPAPATTPVPLEIPAPTIPLPAPAPAPATRPATRPTTRPATRPALPTLPAVLPFAFPSPTAFPSPVPTRIAVPDLTPLRPTVPSLTPIQQATPVPFPSPTRTTTTPDRRCQEVKRRRRRKGICREGFYREFPRRTQFIEWREVECITRRPVGSVAAELFERLEPITTGI